MAKVKIVSSQAIDKHPRKSLRAADHIEKKKIWVVESHDPDEGQHFEDVVPAFTAEEAKREAELVRGRYAEEFQTNTLENFIEYQRKGLKYLESLLEDNGEKAQKDWDEFVEENGDELVRDKNGRLVREEDLEDEDEEDDEEDE